MYACMCVYDKTYTYYRGILIDSKVLKLCRFRRRYFISRAIITNLYGHTYIVASGTRDTDQLKIDIICRNVVIVYTYCIRV